MKIHIEIDSIEEEHELECIMNAQKMARFIWDFSQYLRSELKYKDTPDTLEQAQEKFWEMMQDEDINTSIC